MATFVIFVPSILYLIIAYPRAIRNRLFTGPDILDSFGNAFLDLVRSKAGSSASICSSRSPRIAPVNVSVRARPRNPPAKPSSACSSRPPEKVPDTLRFPFGTERSVITKHLGNVFRDGELKRKSVCAKFAHTAEDGKVYQTDFYNLDAIISVGYRVNSVRGTQFRIWATGVLRDHLVQGYSVNAQRLKELHQSLKLVAITLMIAESDPSEKDILTRVVVNLIKDTTTIPGAITTYPMSPPIPQ